MCREFLFNNFYAVSKLADKLPEAAAIVVVAVFVISTTNREPGATTAGPTARPLASTLAPIASPAGRSIVVVNVNPVLVNGAAGVVAPGATGAAARRVHVSVTELPGAKATVAISRTNPPNCVIVLCGAGSGYDMLARVSSADPITAGADKAFTPCPNTKDVPTVVKIADGDVPATIGPDANSVTLAGKPMMVVVLVPSGFVMVIEIPPPGNAADGGTAAKAVMVPPPRAARILAKKSGSAKRRSSKVLEQIPKRPTCNELND